MDELDEIDAVTDGEPDIERDSAAEILGDALTETLVVGDGEPDIERDSAAEILEDALTLAETLVVGDGDSHAETDSDVELVCESEAITVNDWNGAETLAAEVGEIVNVPIDVVDAEIELDELNDGLGDELDDADGEIVSHNTAANVVNTRSNCECRFIVRVMLEAGMPNVAVMLPVEGCCGCLAVVGEEEMNATGTPLPLAVPVAVHQLKCTDSDCLRYLRLSNKHLILIHVIY